VVLDSLVTLVQQDQLVALDLPVILASKVQSACQVTLASLVSSAGQDLPDHRVHAAHQVQQER